ncbi:MAG: amidohydrolase [Actinomycetales bacterium]
MTATGARRLLVLGRVWTGGETGYCEALAVAGRHVTALGADALALADTPEWADAERIQVGDGVVIPAFRDGHAHPPQAGLERLGPAIRDAQNVAEVVAAVRAWADEHPHEEWIVGGSYEPELAAGGRFDAAWLDAAVSDRPVVLRASDYHTVWCNSEALRRAGVTAMTPDPDIGLIERRSDGSPLGTLREWQAVDLVLDVVPPRSLEQQADALEWALRHLASLGIAWVQDAWVDLPAGQPGSLDAYRLLAREGRLPIRVSLALRAEPTRWREQLPEFVAARDELLAARASGPAGDSGPATAPWLRISTVKFFADGVIEGQTGALLDPYTDAPHTHGMPVWDWRELQEACVAFAEADFQLHIHAIGDAAVRAALDAIERATAGRDPRETRPVIAHTQLVQPADLPRFAALGVIANFEPLWTQTDDSMTELTMPRLGARRSAWQYPMGSLVRSGARLSFGSDWPVSSPDPVAGLRVAISRTTPDGDPPGGWLPTERLTVTQAVAAYTSGSAYQAYDGDRCTLEPGSVADFVLLDRDLPSLPEEDFRTGFAPARVLALWVEGAKVAGNREPGSGV